MRCFRAGQIQHLNHLNELINEGVGHISPRVTKKLFLSSTSKGTWSIIRQRTGERGYSHVNDEVSLDEINASFIHDFFALDIKPRFLIPRTAPLDFIKQVDLT